MSLDMLMLMESIYHLIFNPGYQGITKWEQAHIQKMVLPAWFYQLHFSPGTLGSTMLQLGFQYSDINSCINPSPNENYMSCTSTPA